MCRLLEHEPYPTDGAMVALQQAATFLADHVPHAHFAVEGSRDDELLIREETSDTSRVSLEQPLDALVLCTPEYDAFIHRAGDEEICRVDTDDRSDHVHVSRHLELWHLPI